RDEADTPHDRARSPAQPPRAVDRELRRGWPRKHVRGSQGALELLIGEPAAADHAQLAQQRDVRRRAAEAERADPSPLRCVGPEVHPPARTAPGYALAAPPRGPRPAPSAAPR